MSFFKQFPKTTYDLKRDGNLIEIKDIFRNVDVNEKLINPASAYQYYYIQDGERPDQIANKLYGNPRYYWTLFIANDRLKDGYMRWPMSYQQLQRKITEDYNPYMVLELGPLETQTLERYANPISSLSFGVRNTNNYGTGDIHSSESEGPVPANDSDRTYTSIGTGYKLDLERKQLWIKADTTNSTAIAFRNYLSSGKTFIELFGDSYHKTDPDHAAWMGTKSIGLGGFANVILGSVGVRFTPIGEEFPTGEDSYWELYPRPTPSLSDRPLMTQTVRAIRGWSAAWQAPYYYLKDGQRISSYDQTELTMLGPDYTAGGTPVTYSEWLEEENEKLTAIRVVKPNYIAEFAEVYKEYVNS